MKRNFFIGLLIAVWTALFTQTIRAATLSEFMGAYDGQLLQWASVTALLGGGLRTIFSLQSDQRIVREISVEAAWDAMKALTAGLLAFIVVQALRSYGWAIPAEVRFTAVLVAGWSRLATLDLVRDMLRAQKKRVMGADFTPSKKGEL